MLLALGDAINYGNRAAISCVLPLLQKDLRLSDVALGLLGTFFLWTYALSSPISGTLADRYSRTRICVYSLALWSLVMTMTGFANGLIALCAFRVALGFSESFYLPSAIALIGDWHGPATRARGQNVLNCAEIVGLVAVGTIAGFLGNDHGWRAVFWVLGVAGVAFSLVLHAFLPADPRRVQTREQPPRLAETFGYLARAYSYHILLAKVICAGVAVWIFATWLPYYFHESFLMKLGPASFAGTFPLAFASLVGFPLGGWISDRIAMRTNVRHRMFFEALSYAAAAPFMLLFRGHPAFAAVMTSLLCFGFFRSVGDSNEQAILCEIVPSRFRSTAVGIMNMCATTAGGLGVILTGMLKLDFGLNNIFAVTTVLIVLAALALFAGYRFFMPRDIARAREYDPAAWSGAPDQTVKGMTK